MRPAPGHDRVLVAGQPEAEMEAVRRQEGIPLHPDVAQFIRDTCAELSVQVRVLEGSSERLCGQGQRITLSD